MRFRPPILGHLKKRLRGGLECCPHGRIWTIPQEKGNRREIKAQSMKLFCSRLFWRKDYLKYVKIIMDQAPLDLGLAHNEVHAKSRFGVSLSPILGIGFIPCPYSSILPAP
ncbi:unnamed protein product [Spirodela intermedia]|uniref:Uncharacterized protein n=1 Tax=Spirodela intermedia TaxID=51605 RepID=A0A7I8K9F3_SPIIN|nr:unnamed protein product [Spirodela intermedia]